MSQASFDKNLRAFQEAIAACATIKPVTPMLVLLYSLIDAMAWCCRPDTGSEVGRKDFESWVETYVLRHPRLRCTATDLYAARCGLLHSHSPESRKAREGAASPIYYVRGPAREEDLQYWIHLAARPAVAIHVDALREAVMAGIEKMRKDMTLDSTLAARVLRRSAKIFHDMPAIPSPP